jgi:hypothetical protein
MIADRVPFGVLEMKAGWVTDAAGRNPFIASALARSHFYMMVILDFQFGMCTAATKTMSSLLSSGSVIAAIPATPYPSERYQTQLLWWNRRDFFSHAQPEQLAKIVAETKQLLHEQFRRGQIAADLSGLLPITAAQTNRSNDFEVT